MKRFFAMCMAMVLAFGMVGCNETVTPPSYASDEKFEIGMWVGGAIHPLYALPSFREANFRLESNQAQRSPYLGS